MAVTAVLFSALPALKRYTSLVFTKCLYVDKEALGVEKRQRQIVCLLDKMNFLTFREYVTVTVSVVTEFRPYSLRTSSVLKSTLNGRHTYSLSVYSSR
jgi:hypothetical protein